MFKYLISIIILFFSLAAIGQEVIYEEHFVGGKTQLDWEPFPVFNPQSVEAKQSETAPDGDNGIGVPS